MNFALFLDKFLGRAPTDSAVAAAFARCFATDDGKRVLDALMRHCFARTTDPKLDDASLRFLEGQRQLVLWITQMIAKSHSNPSQNKTERT